MPPAEPEIPEIGLLYQARPSRARSERSHLEALHEYGRLMVNGTIPNHIIQVNYLTEMPKEQIQALWKRQSRRLRNKGVVAKVAVEITKDEWRQRPVNRVHYHFVAKDNRTAEEMQELFECVYERAMPCADFVVHVRQFDEAQGGWKKYIEYFLKLWEEDNYLFRKGGLRRFYTINEWKWWSLDGITNSPMELIDEAVKLYAIAKRLKKSERFIPVQDRLPGSPEPTDDRAMKGLLCDQTDETLYDWFAILRGKPTLFGTKPPNWLLDSLQSQPWKLRDLLMALYERVTHADNMDILYALEIYHDDIRYDFNSQRLIEINGGKIIA